MGRLLVHVEGVTEETFVNKILAHHLYAHGYTRVSARLLGNARLRAHRGGICDWNTARRDIVNYLKEDREALATTMVDYYGLPQTGPKAWPGRAQASAMVFAQKATSVEQAVSEDIANAMGEGFDARRFLPYVMMHEFEGLLFSDCARFASGIGRPDLTPGFQRVRDQFTTPEEINDSPSTHPSQRVHTIMPTYEKPLMGTLAAIAIGLDAIRAECPHFQEWLDKLETWP
jgi:hypothetical protein